MALGDRDYMRPNYPPPGHYRRGRPHLPGEGMTVTTQLVLANIVVFLLQVASDGRLTDSLALSIPALREGRFWTPLTYMFAHGSFFHILFNMWVLYMFGKLVEQAIGRSHFLALYAASGLLGAGCWLLANLDSPIPVVGASGAVFGVMGAAALLYPNLRVMLLIPPIPLKLKTLVICITALEIMLEFSKSQTGVAHLAHLGGLAAGLIYLYYLRHQHGGANGIGASLKRWLRPRPKPHPRPPDLRWADPPADDPHIDGDISFSEIDEILDKIGREGLASLTDRERRILDRARDKLKRDL